MDVRVCDTFTNIIVYTYIHNKDISRRQGFSRTINSNRTFTDTNIEIKRYHTPIKFFTNKAKNKDHPSCSHSPEVEFAKLFSYVYILLLQVCK